MSRIFLAATRKFRPLPFRDRQVLSLRLDDTVPEILNQLNPLSQGQLLKMLKLRCHTQILPHLSLTNKRIPRTGRSHGHADSAERTLAAAYGIKPRGDAGTQRLVIPAKAAIHVFSPRMARSSRRKWILD